MILACSNCGDVASREFIQHLVDTADKELLKHDCGGIYRLMEKPEAAEIMMLHQLTLHKFISR